MQKIIFRVDGDHGEKIGLGHIKRTINLYRELKKDLKNKNFLFLMKNYKLGQKLIKSETKEKIITYNSKNLKKTFTGIDYQKDFLIIDTFGNDKKLNKFLNLINFKKVVSFDNLNDDLKNRNLIFNGIVFTKKKIKNSKNTLIYQGFNYLILSKKMKFKKHLKFKKKLFFNILICAGGADISNFLYSITNILIKFENLKINLIIGDGVKETNPIFNLKDNRSIKFIYRPENLNEYIEKSDICITSGGTVMFECLLKSKPTIPFATYNHQKFAINYLDKKQCIIYTNNSKRKLKSFFLNLEKKIPFINKKICRISKIIDDRGLLRVKNKIIKFVKE